MLQANYQREVRHALHKSAEVESNGNGIVLALDCSEGHRVEVEINKRLPPDAFSRFLANRGWTTGRHPTCPEHANQEKPMPAVKAAAAIVPTDAMSTGARKTHRAVMEALMIAYDDEASAYTSGYTDAKIAEETGAATEYVRKVREDFFGPIAEPPEIVEIREAIVSLERRIGEADRAFATLHSNHDKHVAELRELITQATERLDRMVRKNGWA